MSKKHLGLIGPEDSVYLRLTQRVDWKGIYISRGEIGKKNVEILLDRTQAVLFG